MKSRTLILLSLLTIGLAWVLWWVRYKLFRDGIGVTGHYDDEGGTSNFTSNPDDMAVNYKNAPFEMEHFKINEFDSPDAPGSGVKMKVEFLKRLDFTRKLAGFPFKVNSGYRTPAHNAKVGGVNESSHTRGWAADIATKSVEQQIAIVRAARQAGITRFGIYDTFVHLDCDPGKTQNVAWNKKLRAVRAGGNFSGFPFDPFSV